MYVHDYMHKIKTSKLEYFTREGEIVFIVVRKTMSCSVRKRRAIDSEDQMMMPRVYAGHVQIACVEKEDLIQYRAEKVTYTYDSPFMNVHYHLVKREFELLSL